MSSPTAPRTFSISLLDAAVLLLHLHQGATHPKVGFEDADQTLEQLTSSLSEKRLVVKQHVLESALWSSNLMDEADAFADPKGRTFDAFVRELLNRTGHRDSFFDKTYNQIKQK